MTQQHPIAPLPSSRLMQQWIDDYFNGCPIRGSIAGLEAYMAARGAEWGANEANRNIERERQEAADQELEACLGWLVLNGYGELYHKIRAARRPMTEQKSTPMIINCHWDGPPPSPHASVNDWFEQEGSKGVLYGLRISALPSRGGNPSPKPPSLKEQALEAFDCIEYAPNEAEDFAIIRRALESIPDEQ